MERLKIPTQINMEWEFIPGIGKKEVRQCLLLLIPGLVLTIILGSVLTGASVGLGCILGYLLFVFMVYSFFVKMDGNQSIYRYICDLIRYSRTQQDFYNNSGKEVVIRDETQG